MGILRFCDVIHWGFQQINFRNDPVLWIFGSPQRLVTISFRCGSHFALNVPPAAQQFQVTRRSYFATLVISVFCTGSSV